MTNQTSKQRLSSFHNALHMYYAERKRDLAWRRPEEDGTFDPYKILVSEIMLQQTQVGRVEPYYHKFLEEFPNFLALSNANLEDVLKLWKGLGYNRRARYLRDCAQTVIKNYDGQLPNTANELTKLPGIGKNTAGAIVAYAYNKPEIFIETNIRTVYIYHFFSGQEQVDDREIETMLAKTIDQQNPREFYWALMDYGSYLKSQKAVRNSRSAHYSKQTQFKGSARELRAKVLYLVTAQPYTLSELADKLQDERITEVVQALKKDKLIVERSGELFIAT